MGAVSWAFSGSCTAGAASSGSLLVGMGKGLVSCAELGGTWNTLVSDRERLDTGFFIGETRLGKRVVVVFVNAGFLLPRADGVLAWWTEDQSGVVVGASGGPERSGGGRNTGVDGCCCSKGVDGVIRAVCGSVEQAQGC